MLPLVLGAGNYDSGARWGKTDITPKRTVAQYEIELFTENSGISYINGEEHVISAGCVLLARPEDLRRSRLPFKAKFVHFETDDTDLIALIDSLPRFIEYNFFDDLSADFDKIIKAFVSSSGIAKVKSAGYLIALLCHLKELCTSPNIISEITGNFDQTVKRAMHFIKSNYTEQISVEDVAAFCNVSSSYLYKRFAMQNKTSPAEYIAACRISKAKQLLLNTGDTISEIAFNCGFNSQAYFCAFFKENCGITPSGFRKCYGYPNE